MKIFDRDPVDWSDLQGLVGQLFSELGCEVAVDKTIALARGNKAVDVWVRDATTEPASTILVECKYWGKRVPQEIVHSFRTVVVDAGAHRGFIVSPSGFQSGAYEASACSNVELVTFDSLQDEFLSRWRVSMGRRALPYGDRLFPYWDPTGGRAPKVPWTDSRRVRHRELMDAYAPLIQLGPALQHRGYTWQVPLRLPTIEGGTVTLSTYRQVYDFIERNKDVALAAFAALHGEAV